MIILLVIVFIIIKYITNYRTNLKISVIILNYNRPHNIKKLVPELLKYYMVDEIIISHGKEDTEYIYNHPKVINERTLRNKYYSATRFELSKMAKNDYILFLDDDLVPSLRLLEKILHTIEMNKNNKYNLYGPFARLCTDKYYTQSLYYNIVLTGMAITHKETAIKIWEEIKNSQFFNTLMENKGNGEDILFAMYINLSGGKNINIRGRYTDLDVDNGYSNMYDHYDKRSTLCKNINNFISK